MESVNDIQRERVNFLPGTLFRSSGAHATRAARRSRLASSSVKRGRVQRFSSAERDRAPRATVTRARRVSSAFAVALAAGAALLFVGVGARAELENQIFTAKTEHLRLVVPRGWRATDQPSYPGLLLWMMRDQPEGRIVLSSEPFTRDVYCSWPVRCQMSHDSLPAKLACALGAKLTQQGLRPGPIEAGPKENEEAGLPSVWFEYDDRKHFIRQAVAIDHDHVVSLVLSAPSAEARNAHIRAFEQALRTLRPLTPEELGAIAAASGSGSGSAIAIMTGSAGSAVGSAAGSGAGAGSGSGSAIIAPPDTQPIARQVNFSSAPPPKLEPVGPCTRR
jgi:hypothetical protein